MRLNQSNKSGILLLTAYLAMTQAFVANSSIYSTLHLGIYAFMGLIIVKLALDEKLKLGHPLIRVMAAVIAANFILRSAASIYSGTFLVGRDPLLAPLVLIILGFSTRQNVDSRKLARVYAVVSLFAAWYVIITHGGLTAEGAYFLAQKNQLGAIVAAGFALLLWDLVSSFGRDRTMSSWGRLFTLLLMVSAFSALLLLRNRSSLVALIILLALSFGKLLVSRRTPLGAKAITIVSLVTSLGAFGPQLRGIIDDALFQGYDRSDANSLSADRFDVFVDSLTFLRSNLLFGNLATESNLFDPHNFVLYNLVQFGLFLSAGLLLIYVYFLIRLFREWFIKDAVEVAPWAYMLMVAMFASLLEYAQPFGPGTTQFLTWLFVGRALVERNRSSLS